MNAKKSSYTRAQFRQAAQHETRGQELLAQAEGRLRAESSNTWARLAPSPRIVAVAVIAVVIVAIMAGWAQGKTPKGSTSLAPTSFSSKPATPATSPPDAPGSVMVDVVGKVKKPGVVTLDASARVQDAIKAAGGTLAGTDLSGLNLARKVSDGEQLRVGIAEVNQTPGQENEEETGEKSAGGVGSGGGKISINAASSQQLEQLPGVGAALAQRIVAYRKEQGRFQSIEDLKNVSGIGEKKYAALVDMIRL